MFRSFDTLSRWQVFGLHLLISAIVLLIIMALVFLLWYPSPLHQILDVWNILGILIAVDMVIGPILTLVVFKNDKKQLRFDLSCIAVLQAIALSYGTFMIYQNRPYFQVFAYDRFNLVALKDVELFLLTDTTLLQGLHVGPRRVFAERPTSHEERQALLAEVMAGGPDLEYRPDRYRPYDENTDAVLAQSQPLGRLASTPEETQMVTEFLAAHGGTLEDYHYVPLMGRTRDAAQVLNGDGQPVGALLIDPW